MSGSKDDELTGNTVSGQAHEGHEGLDPALNLQLRTQEILRQGTTSGSPLLVDGKL